jgi:PEP-CTERM motif-containing protein
MNPFHHISRLLIALAAALLLTAMANVRVKAGTFNFAGTTSGGNTVNGTAVINGAAGSNILTITLTNNQTNMVSAGQGISGLSFQVIDAQGNLINISPVTIITQSGREVKFLGTTTGVDVNGSGDDPMGWGLSNQNPAYLNALGFIGPNGSNPPDELILGTPSGNAPNGVIYADANSSIANSGPHQPFVVQTANFSVTLGVNLPPGFQIVNVQMYFGTNADTLSETPEPATMLLLGSGLIGLAAGIRRKRAIKQKSSKS